MNSLVALQSQAPDVMGAFSQGQRQAAGIDAAKREAVERQLQIIGSASMYALNGDPNGQADPAKYAEVMQGLSSMGMDVSRYKDNPAFANIAANASVSTMQRLQLAKSDREFEEAVRQFEKTFELNERKLAQAGADGPKRSLNPVYGTDDKGNAVILQVGDDGTAVRTAIPEGVTVSTGVDKIDLGTQWGLLDKRSGQVIGTLPKDVEGEEAAKVRGKAGGEAQMELGSALTKADQSIALIDQMLAHPGRETATGLSSKIDPRNYIAGTDATNFNVMIQQLQGKAFLEAFESLKGGGQITEVEGQKATQAIARLSTAQSEEAFVESLTELKGILEAGKERARTRAASAPSAAPKPSPRGAPEMGEVVSQDQYDALPSGAEFMSGGKRYRKP